MLIHCPDKYITKARKQKKGGTMLERKGNSKGRRKEVRNIRIFNEMRKEGKNRGEDGEIKEKKNEGWRRVTIKRGK